MQGPEEATTPHMFGERVNESPWYLWILADTAGGLANPQVFTSTLVLPEDSVTLRSPPGLGEHWLQGQGQLEVLESECSQSRPPYRRPGSLFSPQ